jgi:hypothetical protein
MVKLRTLRFPVRLANHRGKRVMRKLNYTFQNMVSLISIVLENEKKMFLLINFSCW